MNAQYEFRALINRLLVVGYSSAIGRADFPQRRSALFHYIRDSKAAAYLNQLPARDYYLAVLRQRVQHQQHRGCVVIGYDCGLATRKTRQQFLAMRLAMTADAKG